MGGVCSEVYFQPYLTCDITYSYYRLLYYFLLLSVTVLLLLSVTVLLSLVISYCITVIISYCITYTYYQLLYHMMSSSEIFQ